MNQNISFKAFPLTGHVRLNQIVGNPNTEPPQPPLIPVSKSTFWRWIKQGKAPKGIKLGYNITVWRAEDIHSLVEALSQQESEEAA